MQAGVGFGLNNSDSFEIIQFRMAYHDLLANDLGLPKNSQIEGLHLRFRFYNEERKFNLEQGKLIHIVSIFPLDEFIQKPSWNVGFGMKTVRGDPCIRCQTFYLTGGPGISFRSKAFGNSTLFLFLNLTAEFAPWDALDYRIGPQPIGGLIMTFYSWWKVLLEGSYSYSPIGHPQQNYQMSLGQRFSLTKNHEIRIYGKKYKNSEETSLVYHFYF